MLDSTYFDFISSADGLAAYAPRDHPIVLFSAVSGRPLAALTFAAEDGIAKTMVVPRRKLVAHPDRDAFQAMISEDEKEVGFALTNFTGGYINFNLMRTARGVHEVDPGPEYGINQVNEVPAHTTHLCKTDQRTHRKIVVSALRRETSSGTPALVTMAEAELRKAPELFSFFPCVNPVTDHPDLADFERTEWRPAPDVLIVRKKEEPPVSSWFAEQSGRRPQSGFPLRGEREMLDYSRTINHGPVPHASAQAVRRSSAIEESFSYSIPAVVQTTNLSMAMSSSALASASNNAVQLASSQSSRPKKMACSRSGGQSTRSARRERKESMEECDAEDGDQMLGLFSSNSSKGPSQSVVDSSFAGTMKYGAVYYENTRSTGMEYDYAKASAPCVVAVSVTPEIANVERRRYPSSELVEAARAEAKLAAFKPKEIYREDICCVCLDEGSRASASPNAVVCTCGHACVHAECAKGLAKCPLCRQTVAVVLQQSAFI
jgi:hypothetical protein